MLPKMRKSLNACTLLRSCGRWHCVTSVVAPMKDKFQPQPSSTKRVQKCATVTPAILTSGGCSDQSEADAGDALDSKARDQRACNEARRIHRQYVPLNAERGIGDRMTASDHGQRRRSHHHIHHGVARHAAGDGDDETRIAHDLAERATAVVARGRQRRHLDELQHEGRRHGAGRLAEIAGGK